MNKRKQELERLYQQLDVDFHYGLWGALIVMFACAIALYFALYIVI